MNSDVPWTAPEDFSKGPSWTWDNPLGEQVRHSPLIDSNKDVYITTGLRVRKFQGSSGAMQWMWESPAGEAQADSEIVSSPVLYGDAILLLGRRPTSVIVYSLSQATGAMNWKQEHPVVQGPDGAASLAMNGTLVFAVRDRMSPLDKEEVASRKLLAVDTSDGSYKWDFEFDTPVWNFAPASAGDGTLLFADSCGVAYKLDVQGRLLWKSEGWEPGIHCSAGGGALGPDGDVFYTSWSYQSQHKLGNHFAAVRVSDGVVLWTKTILFGDGAAQYPAVGRLGKDGPVAVVAAVGDQPGFDLPKLRKPWTHAPRNRKLVNAVVALDAKTGNELWFSEEAVWPHEYAAGDDLMHAMERLATHPNLSPICLPDSQGIPVITGDGTVYASSSHHGHLRAIRTKVEDFTVTATEVSSFHPGAAFLNSPSVAPGMLVAAPCWGPTFVFNAEE